MAGGRLWCGGCGWDGVVLLVEETEAFAAYPHGVVRGMGADAAGDAYLVLLGRFVDDGDGDRVGMEDAEAVD